LKSCIRHLPIRFSELANTPHSPQANALVGQWQGQCIRLWRMQRRRLGFAISLKRMANEICLYNSMLIGSVCAPLRGEGRGRKEKGGGRKGPAPGGPLRAAHPLPSLLPPPWVPGTRPEIPLFVFFLLSFSAQPVISCAFVVCFFLFPLSTFTHLFHFPTCYFSQKLKVKSVRSHF
jgi:hypothetical protein